MESWVEEACFYCLNMKGRFVLACSLGGLWPTEILWRTGSGVGALVYD